MVRIEIPFAWAMSELYAAIQCGRTHMVVFDETQKELRWGHVRSGT